MLERGKALAQFGLHASEAVHCRSNFAVFSRRNTWKIPQPRPALARLQREGASTPAGGLSATHERHLSDAIATGQLPFQLTRQSSQPSLDGNTVDPDTERAAYGRAALEYRASLSFLESKVRTMLTAITGQ